MKSVIFAGVLGNVAAIQIRNPIKLFSPAKFDDFFSFGAKLQEVSSHEIHDEDKDMSIPFANFVGDRNNATNLQEQPEEPRPTLKEYAPFYHTSDEIRVHLDDLAKSCPSAANFELHAKTSSDQGRKTDIQYVTIGNKDANHRVFMLAGEHAREFIAAESALHFLKSLCGQTDVNMNSLLDDVLFQVVVNANEQSRRKAEEGHFCLRVNPSGVDLNRNWDTHWRQSKAKGTETWGGPEAFSEPETRIFRDLVLDFKPTAFVSIHSGTKAMFSPYAYAPKLPDFNAVNMSHVLRDLDTKYCECPFGPAGSELPYLSRGTCMDWVYENLEIPYAFVFELWGPPEDFPRLKNRFQQDLKIHHDKFEFHRVLENEVGSHFEEEDGKKAPIANLAEKVGMSECFHIFNPEKEDDFVKLNKQWTSLYRDLSERLVDAPTVAELNQHPRHVSDDAAADE